MNDTNACLVYKSLVIEGSAEKFIDKEEFLLIALPFDLDKVSEHVTATDLIVEEQANLIFMLVL